MKSMLVHIDASPRSVVRLEMARAIADRHGAELKVLYGVQPSVLESPWTAGEKLAVDPLFFQDCDRIERERARGTFESVFGARRDGWIEGGQGSDRLLLQHALYSDLLVLGQTDPEDDKTGVLPTNLVAGAIADTGRPTLVVPFAGLFRPDATRILVAWKPTREAARAVSAALPFLRLAERVDVAMRLGPADDDFDHGPALVRWLRLQGVKAAIEPYRLGKGDVAENLLSLAAEHGADLLVMGCYGHSRAREWALGGVSRSILHTMTVPVLMAH